MLNPFPSLREFRELSGKSNLIPVYIDLLGDVETPLGTYAKIRDKLPAFLFESVDGGEHLSRYSFIGCNPRKTIAAYSRETIITEKEGKTIKIPTPKDPLSLIEEEINSFEPIKLPDMPPFIGGAVGFVGYEYIHRTEPTVPTPSNDDLDTPLLYFALTDSVIIFDRVRQTIRICVCAVVEDDADAAYESACAEIERLNALLYQEKPLTPAPLPRDLEIPHPSGNVDRSTFEENVDRCKEYIRAGDIIQVVLSQRFEANYPNDPIALYRALRTINPSPYMFLYETGDFALVGASPEVHVRLTGDQVEIRPIAGTRPRGRTRKEDEALEKDLLADPKERAEHLMLVDLARNDIGRVCRAGSVNVPDYMVVERYSHVMHIVSQVNGLIAAGCNGFDLLRATFPAGTVSGAPKIRAMQIISELENSARGPYAGALGYFSYDGNHDSCIAIRTALIKEGKVYLQSGAGIVADSLPSNEYQETVNKAKGQLKAVTLSQRF